MSAPSSMWPERRCSCSSYPPTTPVPASERPTIPAIPRPPRVPSFPKHPPRVVEEVRYDLEHATAWARVVSGHEVVPGDLIAAYAGLREDECSQLEEARCALIDASKRLGGP